MDFGFTVGCNFLFGVAFRSAVIGNLNGRGKIELMLMSAGKTANE